MRSTRRNPPQGDLAELTQRVERLSLVCQAMWELLSQHTHISGNDLMRKVVEVDTRDGLQDGRMAPRVIQCPKCKNNVNTRRPRCVVCGSVLRHEASLRGVARDRHLTLPS